MKEILQAGMPPLQSSRDTYPLRKACRQDHLKIVPDETIYHVMRGIQTDDPSFESCVQENRYRLWHETPGYWQHHQRIDFLGIAVASHSLDRQ